MAIPLYDALSVRLSRMAGDTVSSATTDGNKATSALRDIILNNAIRVFIDRKIKERDEEALRGYLTKSASTAMVGNILDVSAFSPKVHDLWSCYNDTGNVPIYPIPQGYTFGQLKNITISTGYLPNYFQFQSNKIYVTGAGATDSVTVVYVGQHTDLTANTGSTDIAIDSPYWNELLQIALELWKIEILGKGDAQ